MSLKGVFATLSLCLSAALFGCAGTPSRAMAPSASAALRAELPTVTVPPAPAVSPSLRDAPPSPPETPFWALGDEGCPEGTRLFGGAPPEDYEAGCELPDGVRHGPYARFYENGKLYVLSEYAAGRLHGIVRAWHENGAPWMRTEYHAGKRRRIAAFRQNGVLEMAGSYLNELQQGAWRHFDETGRLRRVEEFVRGEPHGIHTTYDARGRLVERAIYEQGELVSVQKVQ